MIPWLIASDFGDWLRECGVDVTRLSLPEAEQLESSYLVDIALGHWNPPEVRCWQ